MQKKKERDEYFPIILHLIGIHCRILSFGKWKNSFCCSHYWPVKSIGLYVTQITYRNIICSCVWYKIFSLKSKTENNCRIPFQWMFEFYCLYLSRLHFGAFFMHHVYCEINRLWSWILQIMLMNHFLCFWKTSSIIEVIEQVSTGFSTGSGIIAL